MRALPRVIAAVAASTCAVALVAACSPSATDDTVGGVPVLHWYVGPDRVDTTALAKACTAASDGKYVLKVEKLPTDAGERREEIVRRLRGDDTSMDLVSIDDSLTAELATAQLLAPVPDDLVPGYTKDVFPAALKAATYDGALVAVPWWFDPTLLWYRSATAERAGLDMSKPVTWDQLLAGAQRVGVTVQVDDPDGRGVVPWVDALVSGAGGTVLTGHGRTPTVGLDGSAGQAAASILQDYAEKKSGAGPSTDALKLFTSSSGGFLLAPSSVVSDPALSSVASDLTWSAYPVVDSGDTSRAPLAGVELAVPLYAPHSQLSYDAISCLTDDETESALMTSAGHSAARATVYDEVGTSYPLASVAKKAVTTGVGTPQSPYWHLAAEGIQSTWWPLSSVSVDTTPGDSQRAVTRLVGGELP